MLNTPDTPKILIVDDQIANTQLLERILRGQAYELVSVHHGDDALECIASNEFDLVLLDVMMPDISGLEVLEKIRQRYSVTELPVILISALADIDDVKKGLTLQANDYISKPIQSDIVRARVATQLAVKRLTDDRKNMIEKLERMNTLHLRLMRIASHDLKNPLHNISMVHVMLEDYLSNDAYAQEMLQMAQRGTKTMIGIIQEFLDLDIVRGDSIELNLQPLKIAQIISEVLLENNSAADNKQILFDIEFSEKVVIADPRRIVQVLTNLVSNAVKYSPPQSVVKIWTEATQDDVYIHVIDQGAGIPIEEQHKLFQAFADISTQPTAGEHSSGLGLWIAKQMMVAQHGEIGLKTPIDGGCDFWIQIPLFTKEDDLFIREII